MSTFSIEELLGKKTDKAWKILAHFLYGFFLGGGGRGAGGNGTILGSYVADKTVPNEVQREHLTERSPTINQGTKVLPDHS